VGHKKLGTSLFMMAILLGYQALAATNGKLIHSFTNGADGGDPATRLVFDGAGNGYGTTVTGGQLGFGTVFELKKTSGGKFQEIVLHDFTASPDGKNPYGGVTFDAKGNLYGTTVAGGSGFCSGDGCGTVFMLAPSGNGWTESIIYSFQDGTDAAGPGSGLVFDKAGNLYGTSPDGGANAVGTVYELSPTQSGVWKEQVIHNFTGGNDGSTGSLGLILIDGSGNLYGVTELGGANSAGTIYKLAQSAGSWKLTTLYAFKGQPDAAFPYGGLIADKAGNLYGTTYYGGTSGVGTVFELNSHRQESVLYSFKGGTDSSSSTSTLMFDNAGNLYGTASAGGNPGCDCGTVFELSPSGGSWTEKVLHRFGTSPDGAYPYYGMSADANGNFYSTTAAGGTGGAGTAFSFKP
jgi:uncharacterized repeat protein (TIGR03803 family)